jgi:hypothetical protein
MEHKVKLVKYLEQDVPAGRLGQDSARRRKLGGFTMSDELSESKVLQVVEWITDKAITGIPPLSSAESLAQEYLIDQSFPDDGERIESLINWETAKNFTSGFLTGLGGLITLPITLPSAFAASWVIQARMSAAIARISGFDLGSDRVQTFVVACLVGDAVKDIVKRVGIQISRELTKTLINKIPGKLLTEINKQVGFRLITKAGQTGAINLMKVVPYVGGFVGGAFDGYACRIVGKQAKELFYRPERSDKPDA